MLAASWDHASLVSSQEPAGVSKRLKSLAASKGLPKHIIDQVERLSNKTNDVQERRNRFVHDAWYTAGDANVGQFKSFSFKDGKFGIHEITQKYLDETIDRNP
jgi:hypothetical protein